MLYLSRKGKNEDREEKKQCLCATTVQDDDIIPPAHTREKVCRFPRLQC